MLGAISKRYLRTSGGTSKDWWKDWMRTLPGFGQRSYEAGERQARYDCLHLDSSALGDSLDVGDDGSDSVGFDSV